MAPPCTRLPTSPALCLPPNACSLADLYSSFCSAFCAASPDFQTEKGYGTEAPGRANLSLCSKQVIGALGGRVGVDLGQSEPLQRAGQPADVGLGGSVGVDLGQPEPVQRAGQPAGVGLGGSVGLQPESVQPAGLQVWLWEAV